MLEHEQNLYTMTELCEIYEISRETGYYWLRRYQQGGLEALEGQGRAPERHPNQTPERIEAAVLELRREHMSWGPRKLKKVLGRRDPNTAWPAASTIGGMLAREGLVVGRKKRRRAPPYKEPFAAADAPNLLWCADFKGWFEAQDGARIDPLTISDACSRYLLGCQQVEKTDGEHVRGIFEGAFRECGMPWAIRTNNGPPFASRAIAGLSRLAVWCMKLGIVPERIAAGHPEQNGRHERMLARRMYTIYFAAFPIGRFDSYKRVVLPLPQKAGDFGATAGEGNVSPSPAPHPLDQQKQKASGMCPV